jgi:predicted metal-binding transcription factor (methanogenesis marker protein 9)
MQKYILALALVAAAATPVLSAEEYYIVREKGAKECTVVRERPKTETTVVVGNKAYVTESEARGAIKTVCTN